MSESEIPRRQPYWLWQTKRLFPHPLFASCISLACLLVGILFAGFAINEAGCWPMGIPSAFFFAGSMVTAAAVFARSPPPAALRSLQTSKPTFAILVLLIGIYSWVLILAMHIFEMFFNNGRGSVKYLVTLGIAIASALFMQMHGNRVIRTHFGALGGRNLELTGRQALYVFVFVISCGIYGAWLLS